MGVFEQLRERGLIAQMTHEDEIRRLLNEEQVTFYTGYDPTADSLHVGHFLQLVVMRHMQLAGHRPIILLGTGTTMVGDPTGKTDMRRMMTVEQIDHNADCFYQQMSKFLDFSDGKAFFVRNGDWLRELNYIEFLRDVGVHFSVNRMLTAECFKSRMEQGLSFLEFNYMLMQSYDFLHLNRTYNCRMQLGGDDQWSNIIAGADLIRRADQKSAYGMTLTLLTTGEGKKMGKTESGAVWLDAEKTSPYEFFQYWRNVDDADVLGCFKLLTFLPMDEIREMATWQGSDVNRAKERLAHELTRMVHGEEEADKALQAAKSLFGAGGGLENVPTTELGEALSQDGIPVLELLTITGLAKSKGEARRLIEQGGVLIDDEKVGDVFMVVPVSQFEKGHVMIRKGKKVFHKAVK